MAKLAGQRNEFRSTKQTGRSPARNDDRKFPAAFVLSGNWRSVPPASRIGCVILARPFAAFRRHCSTFNRKQYKCPIAVSRSASATSNRRRSLSASTSRSIRVWKSPKCSGGVFRAGGPAVLFTCPKNCRFPMLGNLFGTKKRMRYLFRDTLDSVARLMQLKVDPGEFFRRPATLPHGPAGRLARPAAAGADRPGAGLHDHARPASAIEMLARRRRCRTSRCRRSIRKTRGIPARCSARTSACIACSSAATRYAPNREAGMHYQIHRGIGVHHAAALESEKSRSG